MMILRLVLGEGELVMTRRFLDCACQDYVRTRRRCDGRGALVWITSRATPWTGCVCRGG